MFAAQRSARDLTGRHVLLMVLAFFGVIFAVNGVFIYSALSTYSGGVTQEPYRKGLQYNERIAAAARQEQLGWQDDARLEGQKLTLLMHDAAQSPVTGLGVSGIISRPSTDRQDLPVELREVQPGQYVVHFNALDAGAWIVELHAVEPKPGSAQAIVYRMRKRLWLKP
jgi:nitrogen fixation protein FixH